VHHAVSYRLRPVARAPKAEHRLGGLRRLHHIIPYLCPCARDPPFQRHGRLSLCRNTLFYFYFFFFPSDQAVTCPRASPIRPGSSCRRRCQSTQHSHIITIKIGEKSHWFCIWSIQYCCSYYPIQEAGPQEPMPGRYQTKSEKQCRLDHETHAHISLQT